MEKKGPLGLPHSNPANESLPPAPTFNYHFPSSSTGRNRAIRRAWPSFNTIAALGVIVGTNTSSSNFGLVVFELGDNIHKLYASAQFPAQTVYITSFQLT
jgi:hypothetical protein